MVLVSVAGVAYILSSHRRSYRVFWEQRDEERGVGNVGWYK